MEQMVKPFQIRVSWTLQLVEVTIKFCLTMRENVVSNSTLSLLILYIRRPTVIKAAYCRSWACSNWLSAVAFTLPCNVLLSVSV